MEVVAASEYKVIDEKLYSYCHDSCFAMIANNCLLNLLYIQSTE